MGIGNFEEREACTGSKFNTRGIISALMLGSILLFSSTVFANPPANVAPVFVSGNTATVSACMNQTLLAVSTVLSISDPDIGQTETWSVVTAPSHGSLSGFSTSVTSTGATLTPSGVSYTPTAWFTGSDTFMVSVNDGTDNAVITVVVLIRSLPSLSTTLSPGSICDQTIFNYVPSSFSSGATFAWHRNFVGGISNPVSSGTGTISESLINTTYYSVPVTYAVTTTANSCSTTENVVVTVLPTPRLSSPLYDTTCNGSNYSYIPTTSTAGTTYLWSRASVAGISPASSSGAGNINETLTSSLSDPATVVYEFLLTANGCTSTRNLNVTIVPQPPVTSITTWCPATVCAGTGFQSFWAGIAPPAGISYSWTAMNADIWATGSNGQYVLVNFNNPGDASVTLHINGSGTHCATNSTYAVSVGAAGSAAASVIYYNYQLVYLDNTADSYQWGYDDVSTLESTTIAGATFQSYPIVSPDFTNRYYWVMTTKNGCMHKTYYNNPLAVNNVQQGGAQMINVYPNPAHSELNIDLATTGSNTTEVVITNMLGQIVKAKSFTENNIHIDIRDLPMGCYFVNCSQNGARVAASKFIRN